MLRAGSGSPGRAVDATTIGSAGRRFNPEGRPSVEARAAGSGTDYSSGKSSRMRSAGPIWSILSRSRR